MVGNWDQEPFVLTALKTSLLPISAVILQVSGDYAMGSHCSIYYTNLARGNFYRTAPSNHVLALQGKKYRRIFTMASHTRGSQ